MQNVFGWIGCLVALWIKWKV